MSVRIELPKGSLNDPERTDTNQVLEDALLGPKGYKPKQEDENRIRLTAFPEAKLFLGRPQAMGSHLEEKVTDVAVCGRDWIENYKINNPNSRIKEIGDIGYGDTRLVFAIKEKFGVNNISDFLTMQIEEGKPIKCPTELVHLARHAFVNNEVYRTNFGDELPIYEFHGEKSPGNDFVTVKYSDGHTEAEMRKGADIVADITDTGATIKKYKLVEIDQIAKSSVGVYIGPACTDEKEEFAQNLYRAMHNVIRGRKRIHVFFNISTKSLNDATDFLVYKGWCSKNPTIVKDGDMSRIDTVILKDEYQRMEAAMIKRFNASAFLPKKLRYFG